MSLYDIGCLLVCLDFAIMGMLLVISYHLGKINNSKK